MFGSEQSIGKVNRKQALLHLFFGHEHLGHHIRALHLINMVKGNLEPKVIFDAGSGDGSISFYLARRYQGAQIVGVEIDAKKVNNCQLILSRLGYTNLQFMQGDLVKYRPQQKFDFIVCMDVLEHIVDDQQVLKNFYTSLQREGQLILHIPRRHQLLKHHFGEAHVFAMTWDHVRDEYTETEIMAKLTAAGFRVQEKKYTFGWFGSISREMFYAVQSRGKCMHSAPRAVFKVSMYPLLLALAHLDTLHSNKAEHEGFLIRASI